MLFNNISEYELKRGFAALSAARTRKLGVDKVEESESLAAKLQDLEWFTSCVDWTIEGSYGIEFMSIIEYWLNSLPTTEKRRAQALRRIAIEASMITMLQDFPSLNPAKITKIVKASGNMDKINDLVIESLVQKIEEMENEQ